jgi:molybdopterin converting factor small subunit
LAISIQFFGTHRNITRTDSVHMPLIEKARVTDALEYVRNLYPALHLDKRMVLATVNQNIVSLDTELRENDTVIFLPHIGGG